MSVGKLNVILGADVSEFQSKMAGVNALAKSTAAGIKQQWETIGKASLVIGAAVTAAFALTVKSAIVEEQTMLRLGNTLKNVGVNYDDVKDSLDETIKSMEKMSAVSRNELYAGFNKLLNITGDYNKSLEMLPIALDLAKGANIDLETAATMVGKVTEGNITQLKRYGITLRDGATATEYIDAITKRFGGSAEAMGKSTGSAMERIKNSIESLSEGIGAIFLPIVASVANWISKIVDWTKKWTDQQSGLTSVIVIVTAAMGLLLLALGVYVKLAASVTVQQVLIHLGLVAHAVAAGAAAIAQWAFNVAIAAAVAPITVLLIAVTAVVAGLAMMGWGIYKLIQQSNALNEAEAKRKALMDEVAKAQRGEANNAAALLQATYDEIKAKIESGKATKSQLEWMEKYGKAQLDAIDKLKAREKAEEEAAGNLKTLTEEGKRRASELSQAEIKAVNAAMDNNTKAFNVRMSQLDKEYNAQLKNIDLQLGVVLSGYQDQIDAINKQTEAENLAQTKADEQQHLLELQAAVNSATTAEDKAAAIKELEEYTTEVKRNELLRQRDDEIATLRAMMDAARKKAEDEKTQAETAYQVKKTLLDQEYTDLQTNLESIKTALDTALQEELTRYDKQLAEFDKTLALQFLHTEEFISQYNAAVAAMASIAPPTTTWTITSTPPVKPPSLPGMALGGVIPEPTLLTSLRTMKPYAVAGEAGPERIGPMGGGKTISLNIHVDNMVVREKEDINRLGELLVSKIRQTTGVMA